MFSRRLLDLKNKIVRIRAAGITYVGKLLEVTEDYAFIRRPTGYAQIPMDRINDIRLADEKPQPLKLVDENYFKANDEES